MTITLLMALAPFEAQALPVFARQTGQNCVACHAGGQFPELTPYGRMFKMTGYTIGARTIPISVMGVVNYARVSDTSKSDNPAEDFQKNGVPAFATGSLFIAGKVTDNIGLFSQVTYDNYSNANNGDPATAHSVNGKYQGHSAADNIDLRYADQFVDGNRNLVVGLSVNNHPSVSDPWNTAPAWMQYVPPASLTSHQFSDASTPFPSDTTGGNVAGINAYAYWNKTLYAELGMYQTAKGPFTIMSGGTRRADTTKLQGHNPYWRLALTHEWGAHNIMVGAAGMTAHLYDDNSDTSDPNSVFRIKSTGIDAQYQYLLDPHTITAQLAYMRQTTDVSNNAALTNAGLAAGVLAGVTGSPGGIFYAADGITPLAAPNNSNTTNMFRAKLSYIYRATYGGSLAYFNLTGTTDTAAQSSGYDPACGALVGTPAAVCNLSSVRVNGNLSGNPATRGLTYEAFWMPVQYVRVGAQYTAYSKYNGASTNYDGFGRDAKDNNTLFFYVWGAY